jgi:hypothetical protein
VMAQQHVDAPTIRRKIVDENAGGGGGRGNGRNAEAEGAVQEGAWEKENVHPVGPHERTKMPESMHIPSQGRDHERARR